MGNAAVGFAVLGGVALVVLALGLAVRKPTPPAGPTVPADSRFPNAWPEPPPAEVAALLDGLGPGASLVGRWMVRGVSPVHEQRIVVDVDRGDAGFRVWIVKKDRDSRLPPTATGRYALYTAQPRPSVDALTEQDYAEVLGALSARLAKTETAVPVPSGM